MSKAITFAVAAAVAVLSAGGVAAEEIVARLSYHWGPAHPAAQQAAAFAERVNERLKGKLRIEQFPSGQLFGIREIMGAVAAGSVDLGGVVGIVSFPPIDRNYNVTAFPGYFDSFQQQRDFFEKDPVGRKAWDSMLEKSRAVLIAYNPVGPSAIYSAASDLATVDAMAGLKARVLVKADRARWEALKVDKMVSMPTREVYTGLQNGTIDTVSTVPGAIKAYSWWEFFKAAQLPWVTFSDAYIMANRGWFEELPADVQKVLLEEGARTSKEATASIMADSEAVHEEFRQRGGTVSVLSGQELEELRRIESEQVEPELADLVDADVLAAVKRFVGRQ
jgi:TRAP-type C4-dicarboxylate transport system substrate-binding protein